MRSAWSFLEAHGLAEEATAIRTSTDQLGSYTSTLKRGKVTDLLANKNLIDEFVSDKWPNGATDPGRRLIQRYLSIYQRFLSGSPEEEEIEEEDLDETRFAYETDLRDYLASNLRLIEDGLEPWAAPDHPAVEFPVDDRGRRIDILAKDRDGTPVVIELKVSKGHERTIGQALYYQGRIAQIFSAERVRIIIVARTISPELRTATAGLLDVDLFEYRLSMTLTRAE
ncbi:MAG: DUF91 domain-containing protein [Chloroflexi bacterium]|nr:DUF91 domain-containing protein [Chloroflexota bacterium]